MKTGFCGADVSAGAAGNSVEVGAWASTGEIIALNVKAAVMAARSDVSAWARMFILHTAWRPELI